MKKMLVKLLRALLGKVAGGGTCGFLWRACFFGTQLDGCRGRKESELGIGMVRGDLSSGDDGR